MRSLRVEGGPAGAGGTSLGGALAFVGCTNAVVSDCSFACPDAPAPPTVAQACVSFRSQSTDGRDHVRVEGNRFEVGAWQAGILLIDPGRAVVSGNRLTLPGDPGNDRAAGQGIVVAGTRVGSVQVVDNVVEDAAQGIHVGVSNADAPGTEIAGDVLLSRNVVHSLVPAAHDRDRHAVFVGNARSIHVESTVATLRRIGPAPLGGPTPVEGIRVHGVLGPFLCVRQTSLRGFGPTGVTIVALGTPPPDRMWLVAETMADGATLGVSAPAAVEQERNRPLPPPAPAAVALAPQSASRPVGVQQCLVATVTDAVGNPRPGVVVRFAVSGANAAAGSGVTNAAGQTQFCYTGTRTGADTVTAFADTNGNGTRDAGEPEGAASVTYTPGAGGPPTSVTLGPATAARTTGTQHCVTAAARTTDGTPAPSISIRFAVTGANAASGAATTNVLGQAQFCYTGTQPGADAIVAFADANGNGTRDPDEPQSPPVAVSWTQPQLATAPSCFGQTLTTATARIAAAGLVRGAIDRLGPPPQPDAEPGIVWVLGPERVVEQAPAPGTSVPAGSSVDLTLRRDWVPKASRGGGEIP